MASLNHKINKIRRVMPSEMADPNVQKVSTESSDFQFSCSIFFLLALFSHRLYSHGKKMATLSCFYPCIIIGVFFI